VFPRWLKWTLVVLIWMASAAIATTFGYAWRHAGGRSVPWLLLARPQFAAYLIWALILTPVVVRLCRRFPINRESWRRAVIAHGIASLVVPIANALLRLPLHPFVYPGSDERGAMLFRGYFYANGFNDIWMYWTVVAVHESFRYYADYKDREVRASVLQMQLQKAQLQILRAQLQPHFLFNTLHSVSALIHEDVPRAEHMLMRLGDLLRMTLESGPVQQVSLKKELDFLEAYLDIERTRFQDRLTVRLQIAPEVLDTAVPSMLLQPIVENAIRHGIAKRSGPGMVEISAGRENGSVVLRVRDDGPGFQEDHRAGVGLANTRARLEYLYGGRQNLVVFHPPHGGVEVSIYVPYEATGQIEEAQWPADQALVVSSGNGEVT
jgi:two-component system, LytTR family, sensor kinase